MRVTLLGQAFFTEKNVQNNLALKIDKIIRKFVNDIDNERCNRIRTHPGKIVVNIRDALSKNSFS